MSFIVNKLSENGAAEIVGLDCSQPLDEATQARVKQVFSDHPILCFRDQSLAPTQQANFSRLFGPLESQDRRQYCTAEEPDVLILSNEIRPDGTAVGIVDAGDYWHSDSSHMENPCRMTVLYAVRNPATGGDTAFCNMYRVYEALPERLKGQVEGRSAVHHISKTRNPRVAVSAQRTDARAYYEKHATATPEVRQPMVRTHPETGRQSLYISPRFTIGIADMRDGEGQALLDELFAFFVDNPEFEYRHRWRDNDLVMWDNRCLNHKAMGGYRLPDIRRMHRTTICGDKAFYHPQSQVV
jgi:taurine dioxygenase